MTNIVLLTQNRYALLRQSIDSLLASAPPQARHTGNPWTLTVVDDGTTDNRAQQLLVELPKAYCHLEVWRNSAHNLGILKTSGVRASELHFGRGDWLCLMDNDCYMLP